MATVLGGVVAVLLAVLFAFVGQVLVQRLLPVPLRQSHNSAIGMIYAALYTVYGVTLALSLFLVSQYFSAAQTTAESEANRVEDLYQLAEQFPEPDRGQIQTLASSYTRVVIDEEWPLIGQGRASQGSPRAEELASELVERIESFDPATTGQQNLHAQGITLVQDLQDNRTLRLLQSREGIPPILWVVILAGGLFTVAFTFFFGMESQWLHRLSAAALAVIVVLLLYTIYRIQFPFTGDIRVHPDALELVLHKIESDNDA